MNHEVPSGDAGAPEFSSVSGAIQSHEGQGVFVLDGLTAREVMAGASILERQFDVPPFVSRVMASAVLKVAKEQAGNL
jgi:hypothetical protein